MILTTLQITLPSMAMRLARISSLLVALPALSLLATTITTATGTNTNFAAAQLISEPDLIINQSAPNYSLETAQQVSPQYYAADALGAVSLSKPQEFFAVAANGGTNINLTT